MSVSIWQPATTPLGRCNPNHDLKNCVQRDEYVRLMLGPGSPCAEVAKIVVFAPRPDAPPRLRRHPHPSQAVTGLVPMNISRASNNPYAFINHPLLRAASFLELALSNVSLPVPGTTAPALWCSRAQLTLSQQHTLSASSRPTISDRLNNPTSYSRLSIFHTSQNACLHHLLVRRLCRQAPAWQVQLPLHRRLFVLLHPLHCHVNQQQRT